MTGVNHFRIMILKVGSKLNHLQRSFDDSKVILRSHDSRGDLARFSFLELPRESKLNVDAPTLNLHL